MKCSFILSLVVLIRQISNQNYLVSLNNPFLLANNRANITTIHMDSQDNIFIGFDDGQARRYISNLSTYINLTVPEPVDRITGAYLKLSSLVLDNGTAVKMNSNIKIGFSNGFRTIRFY